MTASKEWALIFDLDVLFNWSPHVDYSGISPSLLKEFRSSDIWRQYISGILEECQFHSQLASRFGITAMQVAELLNKARQTLMLNTEMFALIRTFQASYPGLFRTYAMSNISAVDWRYLQNIQGFKCDVFDKIFLSFEMGTCKPELKSYQHLLEMTSTVASQAVLIDDNADNVLAARSLGMHGITFTTPAALERALISLLHDAVERGRSFLVSNAKRLYSITSNGVEIRDNFSQLLIYEVTGNMDLIDSEPHESTWNYFIGKQDLIPGSYPDDMDTTCLALVVLPRNTQAAETVMSKILGLTTPDGIFMTYFDPFRPRTDPMVCVNILRFFYRYGHGEDQALQPTKDWVYKTLLHRAYLDGTRYYLSPDVFLFYLSRLLGENPHTELSRDMKDLLIDRLRERSNAEGNAIELSMRIIACRAFRVDHYSQADKRKLLDQQEVDGGWPVSWLCRTGKAGICIGNRGVATALAVNALADWRYPRKNNTGPTDDGRGFSCCFVL